MKQAIAAVLAAFIAQAGPTQSVSPAPAPVQWHFEWADPYCTVSTGRDDDLALSIWTIPGTDNFELYLMGSPKRVPKAKSYSIAAVSLSPGSSPIDGAVVDYSTSRKRVLRLSLPTKDAVGPKLEVAKHLTVDFGGQTLSMPVPGVGHAMKALEQCVSDSLPEWGIDPAAFMALRARPVLVSGSWLSHEDYPEDAVQALRGGTVIARVTTDANGRVIDCVVAKSSGTASLDKVTCDTARARARFTPAIGADGRPTQASFIGAMVFALSVKPPR